MSHVSSTSGSRYPVEPSLHLPRPGWVARLTALAASACITLTIVTALADYGLPADTDGPLIAAARSATVK
jgi:negative regulator of sigma E activity